MRSTAQVGVADIGGVEPQMLAVRESDAFYADRRQTRQRAAAAASRSA